MKELRVFSRIHSKTMFSGHSKVIFGAEHGAAVYSYSHSQILFHGNTSVIYTIKLMMLLDMEELLVPM